MLWKKWVYSFEEGNTRMREVLGGKGANLASMPGIMDTILNLGLNDTSVIGLAKKTNNPRFAYDSYRRFIQMFSDVVMGLEKTKFEKVLFKNK